jgi:oxygen-dependent protoporphyrinogen oxidase
MSSQLPAIDAVHKVAIIGGGLAGLTAAYHLLELQQGQTSVSLEITLFESSDRLGGVFGTIERDGYRIESGADSFITTKPHALNLVRRLGLESRLISTDSTYRRSLILHKGRPVPTPMGFELMLPRQLLPLLKTPLLSIRGKIRALGEYLVSPRNHIGQPLLDESLTDFVTRRFGRDVLDNIVQPLVGGIYTADPKQLSLLATLPRFLEWERDHGSLLKKMLYDRSHIQNRSAQSVEKSTSGARYGMFVSLREGMSELQQALIHAIENKMTIRLSDCVTNISANESGYSITSNLSVIPAQFDAVIISAPVHTAAKLVTPLSSHLAQTLSTIESASTAIVVTGHRLSDFSHPMDAFGLVIPAKERRQILAVSMTNRKFADRAPAGHIQLRTYVGGAMQPELLQKTDAELTNIVLQELQSIFGLNSSAKPDIVHVARWNQAMPQYHVGHLEKIAQIQTLENQLPRFALTGNAYEGVGIPDVIHHAEQTAARIFQQFQ